jgi:carbonic anhydrase/acetyltransferase-like protein (isoleucine patch superfamily)
LLKMAVASTVHSRIEFRELARRIQPPAGLRREEWDTHPNGGGWVQRTANVASTAYVGPNTIVSGDAQILGYARIVDEASVTGAAIVCDRALVGGKAHVGGRAKVVGTTRIIGNAEVAGFFAMAHGELRDGVHRWFSRLDQQRWKECRAS